MIILKDAFKKRRVIIVDDWGIISANNIPGRGLSMIILIISMKLLQIMSISKSLITVFCILLPPLLDGAWLDQDGCWGDWNRIGPRTACLAADQEPRHLLRRSTASR